MNDLLPSRAERLLVGRAVMESGLLIADNIEQVWTHPSAFRALATWRMCIEAIVEIIGEKHSVQASFIKAVVMQTDGLKGYPYALEELADFLVSDTLARLYWDALVGDRHYPHRCPHCSAAAFVGFLQVDCKARCPASVPR